MDTPEAAAATLEAFEGETSCPSPAAAAAQEQEPSCSGPAAFVAEVAAAPADLTVIASQEQPAQQSQ